MQKNVAKTMDGKVLSSGSDARGLMLVEIVTNKKNKLLSAYWFMNIHRLFQLLFITISFVSYKVERLRSISLSKWFPNLSLQIILLSDAILKIKEN